ncbi:MAG: triose-phosphate isomerase [Candidatus Cloacimonetes bacterium]|nr:triose-phosphate isomerase [Candidatus Cloacimonadota bacterium]
MREILVAGNWKMNKTNSEAREFVEQIVENLASLQVSRVKPIICAPSLYLEQIIRQAKDSSLLISAQDVSRYDFGAYTGEVSAPMLSSIGVQYSLIGHSERRQYHNETDNDIREKLIKLTEHRIIPIICMGEREEERDKGITSEIIINQLTAIFKDIEIDDPHRYVIAYEPVWAIGTGKTATPQMAQEVHVLIRDWLKDNYSSSISSEITILYGGSIKPDNFRELLQEPDIDGGLIGGASLKVNDYWQLLQTAIKIYEEEKDR